jgi:hypothetical protein
MLSPYMSLSFLLSLPSHSFIHLFLEC